VQALDDNQTLHCPSEENTSGSLKLYGYGSGTVLRHPYASRGSIQRGYYPYASEHNLYWSCSRICVPLKVSSLYLADHLLPCTQTCLVRHREPTQ
jgi:hypothetical protein